MYNYRICDVLHIFAYTNFANGWKGVVDTDSNKLVLDQLPRSIFMEYFMLKTDSPFWF